MKVIVSLFLILTVFSCTTKIPRPLLSSQNRLSKLSLWNEESNKVKIGLALENIFLKNKRRESIKLEYPLGIYTKKALRLVSDPLVYYKDQRMKANLNRCKRQVSSSCFFVGKKLLENNKYDDAYNILEKGCNLNEGESCFLAGVIDYNKKNERSAEYFFTKSCRLDSENGCFYQKIYFSNLKKLSTDEKNNFFSYYCKRGNEESCAYSYLNKYNDSNEVSNYEKLLNLCEKESIGEACFFLSYINDIDKKHEETLRFLKLSCLLDDPQGCFNLVFHGAGIADHRKRLLKRALEVGYNNWELIELDPSLEWMRKDKNVREMIEVYVLKGPR
jgi:hypothetical protein